MQAGWCAQAHICVYTGIKNVLAFSSWLHDEHELVSTASTFCHASDLHNNGISLSLTLVLLVSLSTHKLEPYTFLLHASRHEIGLGINNIQAIARNMLVVS